MSRKQLEHLLKVEDDGDEGNDGGDVGGGGEESVDKLRSTYDKKLADLQKELAELKSQQGTQDTSTRLTQVYNGAITEVGQYLNKVKGIDDESLALKEAIATIESMGHLYATSKRDVHSYASMYQSALADALAASISYESGGDAATYKARMMKANTEDGMKLIAAEIKAEVANSDKPKKQAQKQPNMDRGGGTGNRTDLMTQMADIDLSTPEGLKQWEASRGKFQKKLQELSA